MNNCRDLTIVDMRKGSNANPVTDASYSSSTKLMTFTFADGQTLDVDLESLQDFEQYANFAALPDPTLNANEVGLVLATTGVIGFRKLAGLYHSNGATWSYVGEGLQGVNIYYDNTNSTLVAVNVNAAIDELDEKLQLKWTVVNTTTDVNPAIQATNYLTDTSGGAVTIKLPNVTAGNDGNLFRFTMSINSNETIITTVGGTQFIGGSTSQQIVRAETGFTVQANFAKLKYEVIQDNRGGVAVSGFDAPDKVQMAFDNGTRALTLTSDTVGDNYTFNSSEGDGFGMYTDSIIISDTDGLHAIYYDDNGTLQEQTGINRTQIRELMLSSVPVSYILWEAGTSQKPTFATRVLKDKTMVIGAWAKNAFDKQIYILDGFVLSNDPSDGGNTTPDSGVDASAQFATSSGTALWTDKASNIGLRIVGANWNVIYKDTTLTRHQVKTSYAFLQDTDFGLTATGRAVYNNSGVPTVVPSGNFVWYFAGVSNDIDDVRRAVSFMGQSQYSTLANAQNDIANERALVEAALSIRQEFATIYAFCIETKDSFGNATKSRIRDFQKLVTEQGGSSAGSVPESLVSQGFTDLHHHIRPKVTTGIDYTILKTDGDIFAVGNTTITLPTVVGEIQEYTVTNSGTGIITVDTSDSSIIGEATQTLNNKYDSVTFFTDGIFWFVK